MNVEQGDWKITLTPAEAEALVLFLGALSRSHVNDITDGHLADQTERLVADMFDALTAGAKGVGPFEN